MAQVTAHCSDCGTPLNIQEGAPCPNCGSEIRTYGVKLVDYIALSDGRIVELRDVCNKILRILASLADVLKEGTIDIDWTGNKETIQVRGSRWKPLNRDQKIQEENDHTCAFASALNKRDGRWYKPEEKKKEDSDLYDIWLIDDTLPKTHPDHRIAVQVTHLDNKHIGALNKDGMYADELSIEHIAEDAVNAMEKKRKADPNEARKMYLILITSYPIPEPLQNPLQEIVKDFNPPNLYREVWVVPFYGPPFQIQQR